MNLRALVSLSLLIAAACGPDEPDACTEITGGDQVKSCAEDSDPTVLAELRAAAGPLGAYDELPLVEYGGTLFWAACSGDVLRTEADGGTSELLLPASDCATTGLAIGDPWLYVLRSCGSAQSPRTELVVLSKAGSRATMLYGEDGVVSGTLRASDHRLYWTTRFGEERSELWTLSLSEGAEATRVVSAEGPYLHFTADATQLLWISHRALMRRAPDGAGEDEQVAILAGAVESFVEGDSRPHWVELGEDATTRSLWRLGTNGPERALPEPVTQYVAIDGDRVFGAGFLENGAVALRLYRWSLSGEPRTTLAAPLHFPQALVLDGRHAYWLDTPLYCESSRLMRATL